MFLSEKALIKTFANEGTNLSLSLSMKTRNIACQNAWMKKKI